MNPEVTSMPEEQFEVIDENGKVIGLKPRSEVHSKGLRHKGIYLLVFDKQGRVFVQQRAKDKDIVPSAWEFSLSEHLQPGESFEEAAVRGATEELGIKVRNLKFIAEIPYYFEYSNGKIDNELNRFFTVEFEGEISFQDGEVQQGKWIELKELLREMEEKPEKFAPWLLKRKKMLKKIATQ